MKKFYLKKHIESEIEYLTTDDLIFDESSDDFWKQYELAKLIVDYFNYYQYYTPTAFGDPKFERVAGLLDGYIMGKGWTSITDKEKELFTIRTKSNRIVAKVQIPKRPQSYYDSKKENAETRRMLGI